MDRFCRCFRPVASGGSISLPVKEMDKRNRQRKPIPRRFPLESFPDGEWGSAPFDPLAGDERRELCSVDIESKYSRPIFRTLEYSYYASPSFVKPP